MSYDLCCLVMGIEMKEDIVIPDVKQIIVQTEYLPNNCSGRNTYEYPLMATQEGTWIHLLNPDPDRHYLGSFDLCSGNFEYPKEMIKYPYWVHDEDVKRYDLIPLIIYDEYIDEFTKIIRFLVEKSPIGKMFFLARLQAYNPEIVCGTIFIDDFFTMLLRNEILFNVCYILSDKPAEKERTFVTEDGDIFYKWPSGPFTW